MHVYINVFKWTKNINQNRQNAGSTNLNKFKRF